MKVETRQAPFVQVGSIQLLLWATLVLNVFDVFATLYWLQQGLATEANPLMDWLYQKSPALFVLGKMGMASSGLAILNRYRDRRTALGGAFFVFAVYYKIALIHCHGISLFLL